MNAVEFVKKFGWEKSKQIINDFDKDPTADCCFDTGLVNGLEKSWWDVCVYDLKSLVESWELVESYGGVEKSHEFAMAVWRSNKNDPFIERMKQAIHDVESVGGGV